MTIYSVRTKATATELCRELCSRGRAARTLMTSRGWLVLVIRGE